MNTRWHEEDVPPVIGRSSAAVVRGKIITIPAVAEDNDPLGRPVGEYLLG